MTRLDKKLVDLNLARTRSQAQQLVKEGVVLVDKTICLKPSLRIENQEIEVSKKEIFVSRGAHKVEGALKEFEISVTDFIVADVGASTGGFTNFVLSRGAKKVYAIDVGHGQLVSELLADKRVINMEGVNIRELNELPDMCDLAVVDLSFISLRLCLENIFKLIKHDGRIVALVKPQFEVGKDGLSKNGIVKNKDVVRNMIDELYDWCDEQSMYISGFCLSPIKGKTGNQEFFFLFDKSLTKHSLTKNSINIEDL